MVARRSSLVARNSGTPLGYRDLDVYQRSLDALVSVHAAVAMLPAFEKYDLGSQLRRASKSIPANIAEGYAKRRSAKEFVSYLTIAMASANEMEVHLEIALRLKYMSDETYGELVEEYNHIGRQLRALIRSSRQLAPERRARSDQRRGPDGL
jgi:four helix bundle protein